MTLPRIHINNVSKQYRLGEVGTGTLSHDLNRFWHRIRGKEDPYAIVGDINQLSASGENDYVWALRHINLEIAEGDVVGIIGKNGAGKSTLLKILSKVTGPTTGEIRVNGRIGALLEVGTGMHPELTGRENIYLNGTILGMRKREINKKIDEIIEFAGIAKHVDTPLKRYSSGMRVRLGFAVAAFLEPEILIVDEVLAVGDAEFQRRAIGKMREVSQGEGRTVLFVSHNMNAVKNLCNRGVLLQHGEVRATGTANEIVDMYLNNAGEGDQSSVKLSEQNAADFTTSAITLNAARIHSGNLFSISFDTELVVDYTVHEALKDFNLSVVILTEDDIPVFNSISNVFDVEPGKYQSTMTIPENLLNNKTYKVRLLFVSRNRPILDLDNLLFWEATETEPRKISWYGDQIGVIRPDLKWKTIKDDGLQ